MRILWIRLRSLGDILLNLPALDALKRVAPDAHVTYVVHPEYAALLEDYPSIDRLAFVSRGARGYLHIVLRRSPWLREEYEWAINFHGGHMSALIALWSHSREKIGLRRFRGQWIYTQTVDDVMVGRPLHTVDVQARLLTPLIGPIDRNQLRPPRFPALHRPPGPRVQQWLQWRGDRPFVLVHPGARFRWKRWPYARTYTLFREWVQRWTGITFGVFTGPCERDLPIEDWCITPERVFLIHQWSLPEVMHLLRRTDVYVGFDNGITHLAALLGCPVIAIWGPVDPARWAPWTDLKILLHAPDGNVDAVTNEAVTQALHMMLEATLYGTHRFRFISRPDTG